MDKKIFTIFPQKCCLSPQMQYVYMIRMTAGVNISSGNQSRPADKPCCWNAIFTVNLFLARGDSRCLQMTFENSLDPDKNFCPDLDPNGLTL